MTLHVRPSPPLYLKLGQEIDRYTLRRRLNHGWEGTAYLCEEKDTGIRRVIKFYRPKRAYSIKQRLLNVARNCDALAGTNVFATYHHMGQLDWRGGELHYLVFDFIEGPHLYAKMKGSLWRKDWKPLEALETLCRMSEKLAKAHTLGIALGDWGLGNNVILKHEYDPIWIDGSHGSANKPYRDYYGDWVTLLHLASRLKARRPRSARLNEIYEWLYDWSGEHFSRSTFANIHEGFKHFTELTRKFCAKN